MIDAVITFLEVQVETKGHPLGQYIVLNFIDMYPNFPKVSSTVQAIKIVRGLIMYITNGRLRKLLKETI